MGSGDSESILGEGMVRNGVFRGRSIASQEKGSRSQPETKEVCPKEGKIKELGSGPETSRWWWGFAQHREGLYKEKGLAFLPVRTLDQARERAEGGVEKQGF